MGGYNIIATEHGRYRLSGMLEGKLCCEILLLLSVADTLYAEGCGVSSEAMRARV